MQKRAHKSTAAGQIATFSQAAQEITQPFKLSAKQLKIFKMIISSREQDTWLPVDIQTAAIAAQLGSQLGDLFSEVARRGFTVVGRDGGIMENPILMTYTKLVNQYNKQLTHLGLTATARGISGPRSSSRTITERNDAAKLASVSRLITQSEG